VAEHLLGTYGATGEIKWAMAGRNIGKLVEVRDLIGGPSNLPLIAADASEPASLKAMAESAKVIISTVGPSALQRGPHCGLCRGWNRLCGLVR
jgi:short subunit dehydrogenase-like uncharacterized protein